MIINGFGGSSSYSGSGTPLWVTACTFSMTGSYTGSISGGSGDSQGHYILGSSSVFTLPNALAFRFTINNSTTKFTAGTLSRYSSEWNPQSSIEIAITSQAYDPAYVSSKNSWYSHTNCPNLYCKKRYLGSSSVSAQQNLTSLESAATTTYQYDGYIYNLQRVSVPGSSDIIRLASFYSSTSSSSDTYYVGINAYVSAAIVSGHYNGYCTNPAATVNGTLDYIPA